MGNMGFSVMEKTPMSDRGHLRIYGPLQNRYESQSGGRGGPSMTNAIYHVYGRLRPNGLVIEAFGTGMGRSTAHLVYMVHVWVGQSII